MTKGLCTYETDHTETSRSLQQPVWTATYVYTECSNIGEEASLCDRVQHGNMERLSKHKLVCGYSVKNPICLNSKKVKAVSSIEREMLVPQNQSDVFVVET